MHVCQQPGGLKLFCWFCLLHAEISPDSLNLFMTLWAVEGKPWWSSSSWYCPLLPVNPQPGALRTPQHSQPLVASASSCLYLEYAYIYKSELRWWDRLCRLCSLFVWMEFQSFYPCFPECSNFFLYLGRGACQVQAHLGLCKLVHIVTVYWGT